ncbi:N-acetylneuraminate lyase [Bacteroidia bacterium]|nr:N-acetylneuraminate lyase [Bacteroidia bacterium]
MEKLKGMIAATFTPMNAAGEINLQAIENYAEWIASTAIKGVFVCGTTGEFSSLTTEERKLILEKWITCAQNRFLVMAHVGSNCLKESVELARHAEKSGADAIASIAPSFFKPATVTDLVNFFTPVAKAAPSLNFYYYNMPSMTGVNLPVDTFLTEGKTQMPNLAGVKFTHNNLMEMEACIELNNRQFEVFHGYDEILLSGIAMGASAGVGSTYNYLPEIYDGIFKAMANNDLDTARKLQQVSIKTVEVIIKHGGGVRGGKAIMNLIGLNLGECRSPISTLPDREYAELKAELDAIGFKNPLKQTT